MAQGLVNTQPPSITRSTWQIVRTHLCTFFNFIHLLIFISLLLVKSYANLTFMGVVLSNLLIGVVQEIRSKRTIDKLSLLHAPHAKVVRAQKEHQVAVDELVLDDVILLHLGDQIPTDAIVLAGAVEVDESLLTGESKALARKAGEPLLSGSFIVAGSCRARVDKIGAQSYATQLTLEAKKPRKIQSSLMHSLRLIIRTAGIFVLPLGLLLFLRAQADHSLQSAVVQAAASMVGMIPSGLMLLTSVSLTVGVITLSRKNALVQEIYSIETLARIDMLCLDKTGTLTTGKMQVAGIRPFGEHTTEEVERLMASYVNAVPADNATSTALHERFYEVAHLHALGITPFSSARRYSAAAFDFATLYVGAADALCTDEGLREEAHELAAQGYRVLVLALGAPVEEAPKPAKNTTLTPIAFLLLQDEIRPEAADALQFFREEGVSIKIISGDDPRTVSHIAQRLGLPGDYVDASAMDDDALGEAAAGITVFGRVSPYQKRLLLRVLQKNGHTVAMTGDGVNDLLALREADCSIALYNGSDAARQASHIVLLTNDFSALPRIVMEGRRVINNITRTASLFLVKTIYSFLLTLCSVLFGLSYPFQPIHLSLISVLTVGIPSFILALAPNNARIKGDFLKNVLRNALPGALTVFIYATISGIVGPRYGMDGAAVATLCVCLTGTASLFVLLRVCLPFDRLRLALFITMTTLFALAILFFHDLLDLVLIGPTAMYVMYLIMAAACYPLQMLFRRLLRRVLPQ